MNIGKLSENIIKRQIKKVKDRQLKTKLMLKDYSNSVTSSEFQYYEEILKSLCCSEAELLRLQLLKKIDSELQSYVYNMKSADKDGDDILKSRKILKSLHKKMICIVAKPFDEVETKAKEYHYLSQNEFNGDTYGIDIPQTKQIAGISKATKNDLTEFRLESRESLRSSSTFHSRVAKSASFDKSRNSSRKFSSSRQTISGTTSAITTPDIISPKSNFSVYSHRPLSNDNAKTEIQTFQDSALEKLSHKIWKMSRKMLTYSLKPKTNDISCKLAIDSEVEQMDNDNSLERPSVKRVLDKIGQHSDEINDALRENSCIKENYLTWNIASNDCQSGPKIQMPNKICPKLPKDFYNNKGRYHPRKSLLVNQQRLYDETRLSLYRPYKPKGKEPLFINEQPCSKSTFFSAVEPRQDDCSWVKDEEFDELHHKVKLDRLKFIVENCLTSNNREQRRDAAIHLGIIGCREANVLNGLKERIHSDNDAGVKYESVKALIHLGCLDKVVLSEIVRLLLTSVNGDGLVDILTVLSSTNLHSLNRDDMFTSLVSHLDNLCVNKIFGDFVSFLSACVLGKLGLDTNNAKLSLLCTIEENTDSTNILEALKVLVECMNVVNWTLVPHIGKLLNNSSIWQNRSEAAKLFGYFGDLVATDDKYLIYGLLERKLFDDPVMNVRASAALTIRNLDLLQHATKCIVQKLHDSQSRVRMEAVISAATLGLSHNKIVRLLLDMLQLDPSSSVQKSIFQVLSSMKLKDRRFNRILKEKRRLLGN